VCLWYNDIIIWLNTLTGVPTEFPFDINIIFNISFTNNNFKKNILMEDLFKYADKTLGKLSSDECYGFAPLPALGGAIKKEYLVKVKMREYLAIMAQTIG
jgi:hypothetical protein